MEDAPVATVLIVEDDERVARGMQRLLQAYGASPTCVGSVGDARLALAHSLHDGMVLDVELPDGSGLDLLAQMRKLRIDMPVLVVTGLDDRRLANRAHALGAELVFKPAFPENLRLFVHHVRRHPTKNPVLGAVDDLARRHSLSPRERYLVALAASGVSRAELSRFLGVSENTVKTFVRRVLTKVDRPSLQAVVCELLEQATLELAIERA